MITAFTRLNVPGVYYKLDIVDPVFIWHPKLAWTHYSWPLFVVHFAERQKNTKVFSKCPVYIISNHSAVSAISVPSQELRFIIFNWLLRTVLTVILSARSGCSTSIFPALLLPSTGASSVCIILTTRADALFRQLKAWVTCILKGKLNYFILLNRTYIQRLIIDSRAVVFLRHSRLQSYLVYLSTTQPNGIEGSRDKNAFAHDWRRHQLCAKDKSATKANFEKANIA